MDNNVLIYCIILFVYVIIGCVCEFVWYYVKCYKELFCKIVGLILSYRKLNDKLLI